MADFKVQILNCFLFFHKFHRYLKNSKDLFLRFLCHFPSIKLKNFTYYDIFNKNKNFIFYNTILRLQNIPLKVIFYPTFHFYLKFYFNPAYKSISFLIKSPPYSFCGPN